ncbi:MAG: hypothetical protein A3G52_04550 [Candidatus Taylorbacteria bacterium RIFCSPLOWO2_12_FULL_43_20]|uniref:HAD family hydrolase n=1 Tax=Candidatus Taylorbacteria bacterium RIFCSPLOWO2_12_FULL_43_20 TaxID=1802332 RepID=A0A1G2P134_9BACT|nr:MAG: hypothetical protein A2825_00500 [Candidatus Taylorbacteria bacterium RIFCSPHIGHO2_01_FULL_43_120]OHA24017.1 MAG: hypothetical protein A3B98_00970 [Candidatus Taylorbacteria bacterium RIFCSPHIGHO2_02_FULL_43_55]OHA30472.1 MAG: hypothetical protein A3E92_02270 [Candidatus Taylorbacteria bacterium RIFCSPHIGHO2_12_FULL_42_34]OHA32136.1 MAG: hypothetical protein A3B09_00115 [Candidatus Taylorbacteria bacterium RIFCSPLOWO2_01_FULL_43_83]OHA39925.1 MAG: hypothetical protein A3H58_02285 [Candi
MLKNNFNNSKLIIFDLDGTILHNPAFYQNAYSESLEMLVAEKRGDYGVEILNQCRKNLEGKGELSLFLLNIPFIDWVEKLTETNLEMITPDLELVEKMRKIDAIKVIYTGSPLVMAHRIIEKMGFSIDDFNLIIGWEEPEFFPTKWTSSPLIFKKIMNQFACSPKETLAVGDVWSTDLLPAQSIGIKTVQINTKTSNSDFHFKTIEEFLNFCTTTP